MEYVQRLRRRARNVTETRPGASVGLALLQRAALGGAQALGQPMGRLAPGCRADLLVLDTEHPALIGREGDALASRSADQSSTSGPPGGRAPAPLRPPCSPGRSGRRMPA